MGVGLTAVVEVDVVLGLGVAGKDYAGVGRHGVLGRKTVLTAEVLRDFVTRTLFASVGVAS